MQLTQHNYTACGTYHHTVTMYEITSEGRTMAKIGKGDLAYRHAQ